MRKLLFILLLLIASLMAQSQTVTPKNASYYYFERTFASRGLPEYFGENIPAHSLIVDSFGEFYYTTESIEIGESYPNDKMHKLYDFTFMFITCEIIGEVFSSTDTVTVNQQQ